MDGFTQYSHALASLGGFSLLLIVLGALSTIGRNAENRCACGQVKRDYGDVVYRRGRAFMNAIEAAGPFIAATLAAVLVGASPFWVNLCASLFLIARVGVAVVHIGTTQQALRSLVWSVATLSVVALSVLAILGAFQ